MLIGKGGREELCRDFRDWFLSLRIAKGETTE